MQRLLILLLNFTDWALRTYVGKWECKSCGYYKGYFVEGIVGRLVNKE